MTDSSPALLIGVDGGGTSCRFALLRGSERIEVRLGAANVTTDRDGTIATLHKGLALLAARAGVSADQLRPATAHLGLAGVLGPQVAAEVAAALPLSRVAVTDDRATSVAGALGDADGSLAAIGTGSFVARQRRRQIRFAGGWGLVLGDEASGAWLGRSLLSETLRSLDGIVPASAATRAVLAELDDAAGIVRLARHATPQDFAARAPAILAAATVGDATALRLMRRGAAYLAEALTAIGRPPGEPLCLIGGLAAGYAPFLDPGARAALVAPRGSALDGALRLAARLAEAAPCR